MARLISRLNPVLTFGLSCRVTAGFKPEVTAEINSGLTHPFIAQVTPGVTPGVTPPVTRGFLTRVPIRAVIAAVNAANFLSEAT